LLAQYGDARQITRATELLEGVIARGDESTPGDRLVLAQIYESQARSSPDPKVAVDKRRAALDQLMAVATMPGAQAGHLATLIDFLIRNHASSEAEQWLVKLEAMLNAKPKDDPSLIAQLIELRMRAGSGSQCGNLLERLAAADSDPLRPTAIRAAWLADQEREAEIEPLVEPIAAQIVAAASDDRERGRRARLIGDLYFKTGQKQVAKRWYQTAVGYDASQFPAQVRALATTGQIPEAIRLCRERSEGDSASQAATVLALVLAEVNVKDQVDSDVDRFLANELKKHPRDGRLLYAVATLRAVQGRYEESIEQYRSLVKVEPRNVAALNNLAMMLAEVPESRAESLQLINKAIEIAGQQPGLLDTKGTILVYQGESQKALYLLEAAAREAGTDARHRFHLAAAYHGVGEAAKAKQQLLSAIDMNLEEQVLTPTDRRLLSDLKAALIP
jgi:tetratricopeptide (TPR) repeat protein